MTVDPPLEPVLGKMSIMRPLRLVALVAIVAIKSPSLCGQTPPSASLRVIHESWTFKDGAPENVLALAQTNDGFLWLGSETGLFRFDGTRFEAFKSPFGDQLLSTRISSLFAPESGGIWIGYEFGGFSFAYGGRVKNYAAEASSSGTVWEFAQGPDGTIWAATTHGLWRFEHSSWQQIGTQWNAPVPADHVGFDRDGMLWVIGQHYLLVQRPGGKEFQIAMKTLPANDFTLDADGRVLTSPITGEGTLSLNGDRLAAYPIFGKNSAAIIDRTGSIWVGSYEPFLIRIPPPERLADVLKNTAAVSRETYSADVYFRAKMVDREGNIWFGTQTGLERFFYSPLIKQSLPTTALFGFSLTAEDRGAVLIGSSNTPNCYIYEVFDGKFEVLQKQRVC
jgi:ligand-binding sensor domain-containing protein